ncbi:hypothetical protein CsSME_00024139 [Camellia sinensis var. sinensis]
MAASSSLTLSQAILDPPTSHGSNPPLSDRLSLPIFSLPTYSGLKSTPSTPSSHPTRSPTTSRRRLYSLHPVRSSAAVETLPKTDTALLEKSINTIRFLAIDAVEKANSGHPGLPMGCAPMGHILYDELMRYNPKNPYWFNRDRFVLSAGHGCMLQYALLHLAGYDSIKVCFFA